jgi:hypothetical protein
MYCPVHAYPAAYVSSCMPLLQESGNGESGQFTECLGRKEGGGELSFACSSLLLLRIYSMYIVFLSYTHTHTHTQTKESSYKKYIKVFINPVEIIHWLELTDLICKYVPYLYRNPVVAHSPKSNPSAPPPRLYLYGTVCTVQTPHALTRRWHHTPHLTWLNLRGKEHSPDFLFLFL